MEAQNFEKKVEVTKHSETDVKAIVILVAAGAGLYLIGRKTGHSNGFMKGFVAGRYAKH